MTEQERNKETYERICEEIFNQGATHKAAAAMHASYEAHDPDVSRQGGVARLQYIAKTLLANTQELHYDVEETIAEGDLIAARWVISGKCTGRLFGVAGTGQPFKVSGMSFNRFSDGKIAQAWILWDVHGLLRQLGALQPLAAIDS
jgi:steroid delta-isomerase-like uncharacterized protein